MAYFDNYELLQVQTVEEKTGKIVILAGLKIS